MNSAEREELNTLRAQVKSIKNEFYVGEVSGEQIVKDMKSKEVFFGTTLYHDYIREKYLFLIVKAVMNHFKLEDENEIINKTKTRSKDAKPRQIAYLIASDLLFMKAKELSEFFGDTPANATYSIRVMRKKYTTELKYRTLIDLIKESYLEKAREINDYVEQNSKRKSPYLH